MHSSGKINLSIHTSILIQNIPIPYHQLFLWHPHPKYQVPNNTSSHINHLACILHGHIIISFHPCAFLFLQTTYFSSLHSLSIFLIPSILCKLPVAIALSFYLLDLGQLRFLIHTFEVGHGNFLHSKC